MKTDDLQLNQFDSFETRLRRGLDNIASASPGHTPGEFDPDVLPLVFDETSRRRFNPVLTAAAVAAVTVTGLVVIGSRDDEPARSNQSSLAEPGGSLDSTPVADNASPAVSAFRFETPTVALEADTVEVITPAGTFSPTADVAVDGDPGMPDEFTQLDLSWNDGVEQRILIYFESDGITWWASEIRTYGSPERNDWIEPATTGRFFESPLGTAYTGDVDLPNLRIAGLRLQAFVPPEVCGAPTVPAALIVDYPSIHGWIPGGFGATFQVYDTAACTPLPIVDYSFEYTIDDPAVAVITDTGPLSTDLTAGATTDTTAVTAPNGAVLPEAPGRREFNEIKTRVGLDFRGAGSTTLHVTARDATGAIIGTVDVPIIITPVGTDAPTVATTAPASVPAS